MSLGRGVFWKIKEKKIEKKINIDLAIIASQCSGRWFMTYRAIGRTHVRYSRCLCSGDRPLEELPRSFMALTVEMLLVA